MNYDLLIYHIGEEPALLLGFPDERIALLEAQQRIGEKVGAVVHIIKRPGFFHTYTSMGRGKLVCGLRQVTSKVKWAGEEITFVGFDDKGLVGAAKFQ